jgi:lysine 2,3-aminomutase
MDKTSNKVNNNISHSIKKEYPEHFKIVKLTDEELYYFAKNEEDKRKIDKVVENYPVRITSYLREMMKHSEALRKQYLPSPEELDDNGTPTPFEEGKESAKTYGLERVYRDRVLIAPNFECPAYCRYCYKKSRVLRGKRGMSQVEIVEAIQEVSKMKEVRGVVITGGEPLLDLKKLFFLLDGLSYLENISEIRVGTRTLLNSPHIFTDELASKFAAYIRPDFENAENSKYLAFNVHFNHPDELTPEVLKACHKLTSRGITLRNQTVLLKGLNDDVNTMKKLFSLLLRNNIIVYYMNHCMPAEGAGHFRTTVQKGIDIYRYLCTESSTLIPHYVYAPSGGKVHVGPDTKLNYKIVDGTEYIETEMPYSVNEFKKITKKGLPALHQESPEGNMVAMYINGNKNS